jgi:hypothetical protein
MEALLNLVWFLIAVGAVCACWRRTAPSVRDWIALGTFLFLLFPVISLTDDLHDELMAVECATGSKHSLVVTKNVNSPSPAPLHTGPPVALFRNLQGLPPVFVSERKASAIAPAALSVTGSIHTGRAPPPTFC